PKIRAPRLRRPWQAIEIRPAKASTHRHAEGAQSLQLDKKDRLIIQALQQDARCSLSALGKRIGLSQPAMSERVKRLEDAGVIVGYTAKINLDAIGLRMQAMIRVRTTHEHIRRYLTLFQSMPEVLDVVRVTGDDCFFVRCAFAGPQDLERVVDSLAVHGSVA